MVDSYLQRWKFPIEDYSIEEMGVLGDDDLDRERGKSSSTARTFTELYGRVLASHPPTARCGGFSLFRSRPDALPPSLEDRALKASAKGPLSTVGLGRTRNRHTCRRGMKPNSPSSPLVPLGYREALLSPTRSRTRCFRHAIEI